MVFPEKRCAVGIFGILALSLLKTKINSGGKVPMYGEKKGNDKTKRLILRSGCRLPEGHRDDGATSMPGTHGRSGCRLPEG